MGSSLILVDPLEGVDPLKGTPFGCRLVLGRALVLGFLLNLVDHLKDGDPLKGISFGFPFNPLNRASFEFLTDPS